MRADIHDGPEHHTLQPEAGYIDARPQADRPTKASCNARPHHTFGSRAEDSTTAGTAALPPPPEEAGRHLHCSQVPQTAVESKRQTLPESFGLRNSCIAARSN